MWKGRSGSAGAECRGEAGHVADGVLPRAPIVRHLHGRAWGQKPSQNWAGAEQRPRE